MATQSVVHPVQQQKPAQAITQTELLLFLSLCCRLQKLEEQFSAAQDDLKARLKAGAVLVE